MGRLLQRPLVAFLLFLGTLLLPLTAWPQRIALVVGNAAYTDRPLRNPVNDAQLMQTTLRDLGFEVQVATDVDRRGLLGALRDFEARARGAEVALFYYAGHGAQVGGANYLIPLNASIRSETDIPDESVDASSVLRRIEEGRARVGLVILDACRDNPYPGSSRSTTRGLARMSVPTGTIVAYATAPGSTAEDGSGANGTYTAALARYLAMPGLDIKDIFDRTAQEVERVTNGKQRPREEIGLRGRFVLNDVAVTSGFASATSLPQGQAAEVNPSDLEREQQARLAWAQWQQMMQADFDRVGALQAPDLRVQAWQRFLASWVEDNPTSADDGRLREQARQGLQAAQREAQAQQEALAREEQRLSEQAAAAQAASILTQKVPIGHELLQSQTEPSRPIVDQFLNLLGLAGVSTSPSVQKPDIFPPKPILGTRQGAIVVDAILLARERDEALRRYERPESSLSSALLAREIKAKIDRISGLPEGLLLEVEVRAEPDGRITGRRLIKSSSRRDWDQAVLRAIDRTSMYPDDAARPIPPSALVIIRSGD